MDGPRLSSRGWEAERALHVLVVEHDASVLDRTSTRLLAEGCDISTRRYPRGLPELVERLRPDLVLLDVLTPGLDGQELFVLLARCRPNALPAIVLHSKLSRPMLRTVLDLDDVLGVIHKTDDDDEFSEGEDLPSEEDGVELSDPALTALNVLSIVATKRYPYGGFFEDDADETRREWGGEDTPNPYSVQEDDE